MKINKSRYAILGMLYDKDYTGYEIKKYMQESTANFWQESDASLYPMLKKLEADGMVTSKNSFRGKTERMVYHITQSGKEEFIYWMSKDVERGTRRDEFLLKLFFGAHVPQEIIVKHLKAQHKRMLELQKKFAYIKAYIVPEPAQDNPHALFWAMTLKNGIAQVEAQLKWIDECLNVFKKSIP